MYFNQIDEKRRTATYVRISTAMQKTDRQVEDRPNFSILMAKLEMGEYTQVLFNEYSARQKEATENYTTVLKRAIRYARDEAEADALVAEAKEDYDRVSEECAKSLERIKAELDGLKHLKTISTNMSPTLFYTNPMNLGCS